MSTYIKRLQVYPNKTLNLITMKKLLIKWFALVPPAPVYNFNVTEGTKCHVIEVDKDTSSIVEGLGITPEREKELVDLSIETYKNTKNLVECIAAVSKHTKHANELFFVSYVLSGFHQQMNNPGAMIAKMIEKTLRGRKGEE
jgi:hypothetical protein